MSRSRVAPRLWIYGFTPWLISADAAPRQSTLTPLALIGAAHFTISLCTNVARYSGVARSSETNLRSALSSFSRTAGGRALCAIYGKDYVKGIRDGLGANAASMIIGERSYETSTPTIDSYVVELKSQGADIFISITTPKFAARSIKKVAELGWKPLFILNSIGTSTGTVMRPAGFENGQNIVSAAYQKDPTDPQWKDDPGLKNFDAFLAKYFPEGNREDLSL